ncbi:peptidoglycan-binding domain-containing protein [Streptomyces sp. TLI_105]|uniref:peptidoglycan-binding domain-containing protein n=1 Tax=Streptomyces sp. TLI_105 TaxID=1881019 RepID=UPI00089B519D|nr:peptidoglycan-binding domain-containing protein [Streptomyces sp. TLI_105]SEE59967.1 Putative peptidoglycan binding domain-containing protein [Streptomyces sp. TLI_105]
MKWRQTAVTLGLVGAVSVPAVGLATAAPVEPSAATASATCWRASFFGYYCGYDTSNAYASRGDSGAKVKEIQALLIFWGYSVGSTGIDGQFGSATEYAVKRFQSSEGITADGIVGPTTWAHLRAYP